MPHIDEVQGCDCDGRRACRHEALALMHLIAIDQVSIDPDAHFESIAELVAEIYDAGATNALQALHTMVEVTNPLNWVEVDLVDVMRRHQAETDGQPADNNDSRPG